MDADTIQFSIGALITLFGVAMGAGSLRRTVKDLKEDLASEVSARVQTDRDVKRLQLWRAKLDGERSAKQRTRPHARKSVTETGTFCNDESND